MLKIRISMTVSLHLKVGSKLLGAQSKKKKKDMHVTKIPPNLKIKRKEKEKRETLEHIIDFLKMMNRGKNQYSVGVPKTEN